VRRGAPPVGCSQDIATPLLTHELKRDEQLINRNVVHRTLDSEVFLFGYTVTGELSLRADVGIPPTHSRARTSLGELSSMVVLEVFRQGAFLIAHECVNVPMDWHFVTKRAALTWVQPPPLVPPFGVLWCELEVEVSIETKRGEPFLLTWNLRLSHGDRSVAVGTLWGWVLDPSRYRALRRAALAAPESARRPATAQSEDETTVTWDDRDPFLFNRPGDHVVSMALIDAVFNGANSVDGTQLDTFEMDFLRFAERTDPIRLNVGHSPAGEDTFEFHQLGEVIARAVARTGTPSSAQ
jgi:hypothetical protein